MIMGDNTTSIIRTITSINNEYYFSGNYIGSIYFDAGTITSKLPNYRDGFLYKTDNNGNGLWVRTMTSNSKDLYIYDHASDENGNMYITTYFSGFKLTIDSTTIDTSKLNIYNTSSGTSDLALIKYNSNGTLQWAKSTGTTKNELGNKVYYKNNKVIFTGNYEGKIGFGNFTLLNDGYADAYITECDVNGNFINAKKASGKLNDYGDACIYSSTGRNYITVGEYYSDTLKIGTTNIINAQPGTRDAFIAKYGCFDSVHFAITPMSCVDAGGMPSLDGFVTATASDGNAPYSYLWSTGATTQTISNLNVGSYFCTITGTSGCTLIDTAVVGMKPPLDAYISSINVTCRGGNNGSATVNPFNGNAPYSYSWSNGANTQSINNLIPQNYSVTVTDLCGNTVIRSVTISQPLALSLSVLNVPTSSCANTGQATALPINGTPPYTYFWNTGATTQTILNLGVGTYRVTVTDACGATKRRTATISTSPALAISTSSVSSSTCNGSATVTATGGTTPYLYTWSNGQTTQTVVNLCTGTYTVTVKDQCNTIRTASVYVSSFDATISGTNVTCNGGNNGTATVNPFGGTTPYTYHWSNNATTQTINNLTQGTYSVTITDATPGTVIKSITITQPLPLTVNSSIVNTSPCVNTGQVTAIPTNGTSPYTYHWNNGLTTQTITNLAAGTYKVSVTDACNSVKTKRSTVNVNKIKIVAITSCAVGCQGTITANVTGGNSPYTYLWSNGQTTQIATNICSGNTYSVTVTDANGCTKRKTNISGGTCLKSLETEVVVNNDETEISIYPNPANNILNINFNNNDNAEYKIEIYTILGEVVYSKVLKNNFTEILSINTTNFANGIYLLKLINNEHKYIKRFVINK